MSVDLKQLNKYQLLAGVDEAGRGPLAGAVIAAAVILPKQKKIVGLTDSKKLTPKQRLKLSEIIKAEAVAYSLGRSDAEEIDKINILQASLLAMKRAVLDLLIKPDMVVVDGCYCPDININSIAIIKGDDLVPAISAASIIAKVARDQEMILLDKQYPEYGFSSHKGYPTKQHIQALQYYGASPIHRKSFAPVAKVISS